MKLHATIWILLGASFLVDSVQGRLFESKGEKPPSLGMTMGTEEDVISGNYLLYNLKLGDDIHSKNGTSYEGQVFGLFCEMDMSAQKEDPSKVPFQMNFVRENQCNKEGNHLKLDLHDIVQKTKARDNLKNLGDNLVPSKSIPPTAFFYHEGRCGSTLTSNSATALDPLRTRTYSEPKAVMQALLSCDKSRKHCNMDKAINLFQDVVYMMGRTNNMEEDRLFFKLLPNSILAMRVIKAAFPDTPWTFIYRNPVHVMVSNMRNQTTSGGRSPGPYCTEGMKNQAPSEYMHDIVARTGKALADLTTVEYCAAYLASLTEAAMEEVALTDGGMAVNYADMPSVLLDSVFPHHLGLPVGEKEKSRVMEQFGVYSKRMNGKNPKEAKDDSVEKEKHASEEIKSAVALFMQDSYTKLLSINYISQGHTLPAVLERELTALVALEDGGYEFNPAVKHAPLRELVGTYCDQIRNLPTTFRILCGAACSSSRAISSVFTTTSTQFCNVYYLPCSPGPFGGSGAAFFTRSTTISSLFAFNAEKLCPAPSSTSSPRSSPTSSPTASPTTASSILVVPATQVSAGDEYILIMHATHAVAGDLFVANVNGANYEGNLVGSAVSNDPATTYSWDLDGRCAGMTLSNSNQMNAKFIVPTSTSPDTCYTTFCVTNKADTVCDTARIVLTRPTSGSVSASGSINSPAGTFERASTLSGEVAFFINAFYSGTSLAGSGGITFTYGGKIQFVFRGDSSVWMVVHSSKCVSVKMEGTMLRFGTTPRNPPYVARVRLCSRNSGDTIDIRVFRKSDALVFYDSKRPILLASGSVTVAPSL